MSQILLRGGTILQHIVEDDVIALRETDLLIKGDTIKQIGKDLVPDSDDTRIIDCSERIVSPGFVDTHHHVWQTQLKGRHSDDTLLDYHPKGNLQYFNYEPLDIFWGEIGGLLEAIDGGTTTVVDHAHLTRSPDHVWAGLSATLATKIRSVFCYSLVPNIARWDDEFELGSPAIPEWFIPTLEQVAQTLPSISRRIDLGFGFDNYKLPAEDVKRLYEAARKHGAEVITSHWRRNNIAADENFSIPQILQDHQLLGPDVLLSHATGSTDTEFNILREAGAYLSCTPATESQMAHGSLVGFRGDVLASLGADCHSNNPGSMLHAMQCGLAVARSHRNSRVLSDGKFPLTIEPSTLQAYNLATIHGARAIRRDSEIGSLQEGKKADIAIFDTKGPAMACVADENPLVAVVRHATTADTVIIGGDIVKDRGKLADIEVDDVIVCGGKDSVRAASSTSEQEHNTISWEQIAKELKRSRIEVQKRIDKCNMQAAREAVVKMWGMPDADKVLV